MLHRFTLFAALLGLGLSSRAAEPDYSQYEIKTWSTATYDVMVGGLLESSQTDALGNTSKSRSDKAGRTRISIDAAGNSSTAFFDANGNLVQSRDALNHGQNCAYDALNRRTSCADTHELAEGKSRSTTYNASGAVLSQTDTKGAVTSNSYDLRNRLVAVTERATGVVAFAYDAKGQRTSVTDQLGKVTSYQFNPRGELIKTINADASVDETVFDALGRKIKVIHPGGNSAVMAYDLASRLLSRNYFAAGSGIAESTDSFTYDLASRPLTANNADAQITYTYDSIGRRNSLTQVVDGLAKTVNFVYDAANRLLSRSPEGLAVESRSFTNRGQLASVSLGAPHADAGLVASFTYDAVGRETSRTYGNGLNTTSGYSRADNLITSITVANKPELSFNYSYDSNKNVTAEQRGGSMALYSWTATFDNMDRLNSQNDGTQTRSWNLDLVGNTTSETLDGNAEARALNDMHAPTAAGNKAYSYDSNGQMTAKPGYTLTWDARNHLVSSLKTQDSQLTTYRYDAFGNRVSKGDTRYLLVDNQVVAEFTGSASKQYAYGSYIDEVLAEVASPSSPFTLQSSLFSYYHRNRQYNTVALTDAAGAIIEQYSTDAMGRVKAVDAAGAAKLAPTATTVLFTGRVFDPETGLYYFRARYFEPELGVFVSRDPMGFVDGQSVYQGWFDTDFSNDPSGLWTIERKNGAWARAIPDPMDTVFDLAKLIYLNDDEATKWLKVQGLKDKNEPCNISKASFWSGNPADPVGLDCVCYWVPNTISIYVAERNWNDTGAGIIELFWKTLVKEADGAEAAGFNVNWYKGGGTPVFEKAWKDDGIYMFAFCGHGSWEGYYTSAKTQTSITGPGFVNPPYHLYNVVALYCQSAWYKGSKNAQFEPGWWRHKSREGMSIMTDAMVNIFNINKHIIQISGDQKPENPE
jgi:RHS repeat-associated protein